MRANQELLARHWKNANAAFNRAHYSGQAKTNIDAYEAVLLAEQAASLAQKLFRGEFGCS